MTSLSGGSNFNKSTAQTTWLPQFTPSTGPMLNGKLKYAISGGTLTISDVLNSTGLAPSATTDSLYYILHDGSGGYTTYTRTSQTTLALTATDANFNFTAGQWSRLWVVMIDDNGTLRLGVINLETGLNSIYCNSNHGIYNENLRGELRNGWKTKSVAAGSGTQMGLMYANATNSTLRPYTILGYIEWPNGLTSIGSWNDATPTGVVQRWFPGAEDCKTNNGTGKEIFGFNLIAPNALASAVAYMRGPLLKSDPDRPNVSWCRDVFNKTNMYWWPTTVGDAFQLNCSDSTIPGYVHTTNLTGTCTSNTGSATVTGTSTLFLSEFGTTAATGTISTSTTAVTGSSTRFMTELALGDLIGDNTLGYSQVSAIASDTACTLAAALPGGNKSNGAYGKIEFPTIKVTGKNAVQVLSITSDTTLTVTTTQAVTATGQTAQRGNIPTQGNTMPIASYFFLYVWVIKTNSGTVGIYLSTQRSYNSLFPTWFSALYFRRVGSMYTNASNSSFVPFEQYGNSNTRTYQYEVYIATQNMRILAAGAATSWTSISAAGVAPSTATALIVALYATPGAGTGIRRRGAGATATGYRSGQLGDGTIFNTLTVACDEAQYIDYSNSAGGGGTYIDIGGYVEEV